MTGRRPEEVHAAHPFHSNGTTHPPANSSACGVRGPRRATQPHPAAATSSISTLARRRKRASRAATAARYPRSVSRTKASSAGAGHADQGRQLAVGRQQQGVGALPDGPARPRPGCTAPGGRSRASGPARATASRRPGAPQPRRRAAYSAASAGSRAAAAPRRVPGPPSPGRRPPRPAGPPPCGRTRRPRCAGSLSATMPAPAWTEARPSGRDHQGADGDGGVEVAREVEVADHPAVDARAWSARGRR